MGPCGSVVSRVQSQARCSPPCSHVHKLPRRAVQRELQQQEVAQARGRGASQAINRWVAVSTCSVCGQEARRRLQHPPTQQQQHPPSQQQQQQQQQPQKQPPPLLPPPPQKQQPPQQQPPPPPQQQQKQQQHLISEASAPTAAEQKEQQVDEPQQQQDVLQLPAEPKQQRSGSLANECEEVPALLQKQQPVTAVRIPEAAGQLAPAGQQQAAGQLEQEQHSGDTAPMAWAAVQQAWGLQPSQAEVLLPIAPSANLGENADKAGDEAGEAGGGSEVAAMPSGTADAEPPRKRRRLSWSDNLQQVKLIDRAPRPQLRKVYSWHRLARSWKAASFHLG